MWLQYTLRNKIKFDLIKDFHFISISYDMFHQTMIFSTGGIPYISNKTIQISFNEKKSGRKRSKFLSGQNHNEIPII